MAYVHTLVSNAVRQGQLVRPLVCEACGNIRRTWAHHDDYLKPLEVRWLCKPCHHQWHVTNGPGLNAEIADLPATRSHNLSDERRKAKIQIDDARFNDMSRLIFEGWTLQKVGDHYGVSRERVRQIVGSPRQYRELPSKVELSESQIQEINALRRDGKTFKKISQDLGIPFTVLNGGDFDKRVIAIRHGSLQGYRRGCRCDLCREANYSNVRKTQKRMREQGRCVACCKPSGGKWRCGPCYEKWSAKYKHTGKGKVV
jgi:hypothetical protein